MIVAATGHRPDKLGGYLDSVDVRLRRLAEAYLNRNYGKITGVISGMALGWDLAWAEQALAMQIPLIAAVPCDDQEKPWPLQSRQRYNNILAKAMTVVIVSSGPYAPWKMQARNKWMVDRSRRLASLYDGISSGGTANCFSYANLRCVPVDNLWDEWKTIG